MNDERKVPFIDLRRQYGRLRGEINAAIQRVFERGSFILGPETEAFEHEFAQYVGAQHAVSVASGTDALVIALRALDLPDDAEVITVSNTAVATVAAIGLAGATAVLTDIEEQSMNISPQSVEALISPRTRAVIAVHLFGLSADLGPLRALCDRKGLFLVEDASQAHTATYQDRHVGSVGHAATYSFYPTKNLGAYGDAGLVTFGDPKLAARARLLRQYGWARRYVSDIEGYNSRMDELHAAMLRVKLKHLSADAERRRAIASYYRSNLADTPLVLPGDTVEGRHAYHLFVVRSTVRNELRAALASEGIDTALHYPVAVHQQPAYTQLRRGNLEVTERATGQIVSLPLYPDLTDAEAEHVVSAITRFYSDAASR